MFPWCCEPRSDRPGADDTAALQNRDAPIDGNRRDLFNRSAQPADLDSVDPRAITQAEVQPRAAMALVASAAVHFIHQLQVAGDDPNSRPDAVAVRAEPRRTSCRQ